MLEKKGFTLVELLVVMVIIGILAAAAVVNFGKNEDREVRAEKDRLVAYLREVQNKAIVGETESINLSGARLCGFGVAHNSTDSLRTYYVLGGLNDNCVDYVNSSGTDYPPVFYLNNGVTIKDGFASGDKLFFLIPNGQPYFNGDSASNFPRTINLTKSGATVPVTIEQSGRIY